MIFLTSFEMTISYFYFRRGGRRSRPPLLKSVYISLCHYEQSEEYKTIYQTIVILNQKHPRPTGQYGHHISKLSTFEKSYHKIYLYFVTLFLYFITVYHHFVTHQCLLDVLYIFHHCIYNYENIPLLSSDVKFVRVSPT